jgi:single-strand DNA-binding protein
MSNFNKILLMGRLTRDPQLSYTPSQTAVVDFGMAVNRNWKGQDGSQREETCFVDCRAFGRTAETINKYLSKGRPAFIEGRLTFDSWTAQDGTKRSRHRVTVERFQFLPGGGGAGGGGSAGGGGESRYDESDSQVRGGGPPPDQGTGADDIPF